jgi:hypothetical protein
MSKKQPAKATNRPKAAAPAPRPEKREMAPKVEKATVSTTAQPPDPRLPSAGTTIQKRDRHGAVRCECKVEEGGIRILSI